MRVVLDTNVLVSGLIFSGPPAEILRAWAQRRFTVAISPEVQDECEDVARRMSTRYPAVDLRRLFDLVLVAADMYTPAPLAGPVCSDPSDDKFFACAIGANADIIVSGVVTSCGPPDSEACRSSHRGHSSISIFRERRSLPIVMASSEVVPTRQPAQGTWAS
jgi:putative PIN family toxin of toxin-antitoxin system